MGEEQAERIVEELQGYADERDKNRMGDYLHKITISTCVPLKWRFVDMETGQTFKWDDYDNKFVIADDIDVMRKINWEEEAEKSLDLKEKAVEQQEAIISEQQVK